MVMVKKVSLFIMIISLIFTSMIFQPVNVYADQMNDGVKPESEEVSESSDSLNADLGGANASPVLSKATINGNILTMCFDKALDIEKVPSTEAFTIRITDTNTAEPIETSTRNAINTISSDNVYNVSEDTVYTINADTADIVEINIYDNKAVLTLNDAVTESDHVALDYNPSGDGALSDQSGNTVEGFSDYIIDNITGGSGLPNFVVEEVYNELDTSSISNDLARQIYYAMLGYKGSKQELLSASGEIVDILQSSGNYGALTEENKTKLSDFFGVNDAFFIYCEGIGESVGQAILIHAKMEGCGLSEEEIEQSILNNTRDEIITEKEQELSDQVNGTGKLRASALTTGEDPFAGVEFDKGKTLSAPFQHNSAANEQVDLSSGILDYNVTDAALPGKGGLDLVIERQYSTEDANYYDVTGQLQYIDWDTERTESSYMRVYQKEKHFGKNADGTLGDYIEQTSYDDIADDIISSDALRGLYNMKQIVDEGSYYSASLYSKSMITDTHGINDRQVSDPITSNEQMWQLGAGWKLHFSYMDIDSFDYNYMKLHLADGREFGVSPNWVNNLGYYTYKDVIFATESVNVSGQTSSYSVTYADGKKEYFDGSGRLIAIVDRFGNTISFSYTTDTNHMLEIHITDTLGRTINLTNQATSVGYNKILTLPDGKTITYVLSQNTARTLDAFDEYEDFPGQFNEYNLSKVINQKGEETIYTYTDIKCGSDFAARYHMGDYMGIDPFDDEDEYYPNYYAGLTKITYPTGLMVNYDYYLRYNAWYDYGCMTDIAIKKRYDQQGSSIYNEKDYDYYNRFEKDGVLMDILYNADDYHNDYWNNWCVSVKDVGRDFTTKYYFDNSHGYCVSENVYLGSDLIQSTSNEYRTFNKIVHPSKTNVTTVRYNTSNDQPLTTIECYDYDNRGNAVSYWPALSEGHTADTEYKVSMTYDNLYNYLTSKTYKRDASTTIYEQNVPSVNEKTVTQSLVKENGILKAKTEFGYDTYGNVTETKDYTDINAGTYNDTINDYTNGTYLTNVSVQNVKDADGTNIGSISRQATYDIYGRILTETDSNGNVTSYAYDDIGRLLTVTYPGSITKTYAYNTALNQTTVTDERGFITRYQYDPAGNLTAVYSMNSGTATLLKANEYDSLYRLTKEQNNLSAGGGSTTYSYDYIDRITQKTAKNASNQILVQENYTCFDDKTTKTVVGDANSEAIVTTEYTDKYGRITKQGRFIDGTEVFNTFAYNYLGEVLQEKSARANAENYNESYTTKYEYDYAGNIKKQYDVLGNYITNTYDAAGRKISVTDAKSNAAGGTYSTVYTYDALGNLVKEETPFTTGSTAVTKYYYANGNLTQKLIENSLPGAAAAFTKVEYSYNNRNQLVQVKSYNGGTVANQVDYEYDAAGNMTAMVTGNGTQRTEYEYDRYGNQTKLTDPLGQEEIYTYNINGNMTSKTDKNGQTTTYTYDGLARKLSQSVSGGAISQLETMAYTATGALANAQNENIQTVYIYDELGRLITEIDSNGVENNYTYDVNGNLKTSIVKVNSAPVKAMSFYYDKKDRLAQVYEAGTLVATYTYDANGNRSTLAYGNGTSVDYAYNLANLVTSLQNKKGTVTLSGYSYTYFLDGNQATKNDSTGHLTNYNYDGLGRLTQEAESGASDAITKVYTFNPAGNRATMVVSGAEAYTVGYVYDLNNRLTAETKEAGSATDITDYYYDNNGNTIAKRTGTLTAASGSETPVLSFDMTGAELYSYDGFDRMIGAQNASGSSIYTYKPDGLRLSKTVNGVKTTHVWDGKNISLELDGSGAVANRYIRGIGLIKSDDNGWYLFNGHGDVVQLADNTGVVTKTYAYDAFGNEKNIDANDTNPFRYSGEYFDKETGTVYLRARYYEPEIGRFLSEDNVTGNANDPLSLNLYTYCENDPVNYIDITGHDRIPPQDMQKLLAELKKRDPQATMTPLEGAVAFGDFMFTAVTTLDGVFEVKVLVKGVPLVIKGIKAGSVAEAKIAAMEVLKAELRIGAKDSFEGGVKAIAAPTNRSGLKNAMLKLGGKPFEGAEAHHLLPWNYREWFASKGLNVNSPEFGVWVRGGGNGGHQSWSKAYDAVWNKFIKENPDANAKQIKDFLNKIRTNPKWDGGF